MDLTKIPTFHPRVVKVDLLSGKAQREPGVAYQCHLKGGKHTCIEKDIEIVPMEKIADSLLCLSFCERRNNGERHRSCADSDRYGEQQSKREPYSDSDGTFRFG